MKKKFEHCLLCEHLTKFTLNTGYSCCKYPYEKGKCYYQTWCPSFKPTNKNNNKNIKIAFCSWADG